MANCSTYINSSGDTLYHLRRIGPPASKDGVVSIMDLFKPTYMIGRNAARVDFYIDSSIDIQSQSLSRCHARVVRQSGNQHRVYDDSLNGIYVNNMKIAGSCILNEGDKVIFGHPSGARLPAGSRSRQPNSEHQFMFEMCSCNNPPGQRREEVFKKPVSPRIRSPESSHSQQKYTQNNTESKEDINTHPSLAIQSQAPPIQSQAPPIREQAPPIQEQAPSIQIQALPIQIQAPPIQEQAPPIQEHSPPSCSTNQTSDGNVEAMDLSVPSANQVITNVDLESSELAEATDADCELHVDEVEHSQDHNVSELEVTVNSILSDLCTIRGAVENDCSVEIPSEHAEQFKSPTKDVSIQTTQRDMQCILSPTKDMGIQTSQAMFNDDSVGNPENKSVAVTTTESSSTDHVGAESVDSEDDDNVNTPNQVCNVDTIEKEEKATGFQDDAPNQLCDLDSKEKEESVSTSQNSTMDNGEVDNNQEELGEEKLEEGHDSEGRSSESEHNDMDEKVVNAENNQPNDESMQQKSVNDDKLKMLTVQQEISEEEYQTLAVEQKAYQVSEIQKGNDNKVECKKLTVQLDSNDTEDSGVPAEQPNMDDTDESGIPSGQPNVEENEEFSESSDEAECVLLPKLDTDNHIGTEVKKMPQLVSCIDSPHLSLSDSIAYGDDETENDAPILIASNSMEFDEDYSNDDGDEFETEEDDSEQIEDMNCENTEEIYCESTEEIYCETNEEDSSEKVLTCDSGGYSVNLVDNTKELKPGKNDEVAVDNEENSRKRKMSSDISDNDSGDDNARKRHCSETLDVHDMDTESPDMEVDQEVGLSSNEEKEAKVILKNLEKLKDGMKHFFDLWSQNSSAMSSPCSSEYVFIQDRSGKVEQLHLDVPVDQQNVVDELGQLENTAHRGSDLDNGAELVNTGGGDVNCTSQASLENGAVLENNDRSIDISQASNVSISDNLGVNKAGTDFELENKDSISQASDTGISDSLAVNTANTDSELESKDEDVVDEITSVSSVGKEDYLETYVKSSQFGEDIQNEVEVETSLYPAVNVLEEVEVPDAAPKSSDSSCMSPVIERFGVNSVIEKSGVNSKSWLSTLPLEQSKENVLNDANVSGCEFTDDENDDDDFPSPEIDFNYMSDDYDENWCGERLNDSLEEDYELSNEDCNNSDNDDLSDNKSDSIDNKSESEICDELSNIENDVESVKIMGSSSIQVDYGVDNIVIIDDDSAKDADSELDGESVKDVDSELDGESAKDADNELDGESFKDLNSEFDKESAKDDDSEFDQESAKDDDNELDELLKCAKESDDQIKNIDRSFEVDFDFCDSESEDIKPLDNGADAKESELKRKSNSHTEDVVPKKTKTGSHNKDLELPVSTNELALVPFKTPTSSRHRLSAVASHQSPGVLSCTQLMEFSQSPDLDTLSATQLSNIKEQLEVKVNDKSKSKDSSNKAKNLLEKLRARKRVKEEANDSDGPTNDDMETESSSSTSLIRAPDTQEALDDINKHVQSCRLVVDQMKSMFDRCNQLRDNPRVQAWRRELSEVEKRIDFAKTVIAVVGDTGAGKSSLMNAVLDHRSVLPTSGMRACTAVVVEVVQNTQSNEFVADIEFLQRKEWFDELQILLNDLRGLDGTIKNRSPDPTSDAYVSYCKVKAVYGRIDNFNVLSRLTMVTHWLGKVKVIRSRKAEDFRKQVEKYIETQEPTGGGQYWPIVKHVTLKIPNCDVCSTGASLVDLPGVRDSNAARDKIAREYLKNCTAVWVVSSIHRAIDDKTAKDLLGENFRRQLLMDGQYGSIAFICTKTDVIIPSEIIRSLRLEEKTGQLEEEIKSMEAEKCELDLRIIRHPKEVQSLNKQLDDTRQEKVELEESLSELKSLLADSGAVDSSQSDEKEAIKEYEDELTAKTDEIEAMETRLEALIEEKQYSAQKVLELEGKLNARRKTIAALCAEARNEYSKSQIRRDFKAGLKEMKRRAGMIDDDDNEEEDIYSDDDDDDDGGDIGSNAEHLKVFCCSSTEYQKMKNLLTDDGPPQVFSSLSDTQIPALRSYVHEMTSIRRRQSLERLIRNLGSFVFDVQTYLTESGDTKYKDRQFVKSVIESELSNFDQSLAPVIQQLVSDIDDVFDGSIKQKLEQGASNATSEANDTCNKWGAPVNRDKNSDKRLGGLHFQTYRATVRRQGVFKSPSYGNVDFNEDLTEPMYRSLTIVWDRAFSGLLWKILDKIQGSILGQIKLHCFQLGNQLVQLGIPRDRINRVSAQLEGSASNKLKEMVGQLKETVTNQQRDISRLITPHIQSSLTPIYDSCAGESGTGMYMRIKTCMSQGIDSKRMSMFDEATFKLMQALIDLQNEMIEYVRQVTRVIIGDLRTAFEPLWDTPGNSHQLKAAFTKQMLATCSHVRQIYDGAGLTNTEERTVNTTPGRGAASSTQGNQVQQASSVRIKIETSTTTSCTDRTMNIIPTVHPTLYIKQEKKVFEHSIEHMALSKPDAPQFGIQTLQDLQDGKLDISPVEVTVQSTPRPYTVPRVATIHINPQTQAIVQPAQKRSKASSTKTLSSQCNASTLQALSHTLSTESTRNPTTSNTLQYGNSNTLQYGNSNTLQYGNSNPPNFGLLHTLPDGSRTVQPYNLQNLPSGQKILMPASTSVPSVGRQSMPSVGRQNIAMKSIIKSEPNTLLNINKENHTSVSGASSQQARVVTSSQPKVMEKTNKKNLSLSQRNNGTPVKSQTLSNIRIKTEPADNGTYGRRRPKYLGTIDLTDD